MNIQLRTSLVALLLFTGACGDGGGGGTADTAAADVTPADTGAAADDTGAVDTGPVDTTAADTTVADTTAATPATLGGDRPATVYYPADYGGGRTWPLVILLHGYSASGVIQDFYLGFHAAATAAGYVTVVPEGTVDGSGNQFWNADPSWCCNFGDSAVDDEAYLLGLVAEATAQLPIDPARVYLVGHSNGGFMAHRMACDHADVVAGVASLAGGLAISPADCAPSGPVTVLQIHGTLDDTIRFSGEAGKYPGAIEIATRWAGHDGCDAEGTLGAVADYDDAVAGDEATQQTWGGCDAGVAVGLWTLTGSGHIPTVTEAFLPAVFAFFEAHQRTR